MKHGKDIINQQLVCERVADCVIDLYAMAAVVSRATAAKKAGSETADHEVRELLLTYAVTCVPSGVASRMPLLPLLA